MLRCTSLLFYNARYYDPNLGRFLSADTIVPGSSALTVAPLDSVASASWRQRSGGPANPQELNRYSYVNNNPLRYTDPSGHCPMCIGAFIGALAGASIAYGAQVYSNYQAGMDVGQAMTTNINVAAVVTGGVAGAVVGGSLGIASTGAITGYTVGTALEMGAIGSATNMAGNAVGQIASSGSVNPTDVAVAGVVGFAAGVAAPAVGTTAIGSMAGGYAGAVGLGATANTAQYVATQSIKGDRITGVGLGINALSGAVAGGFGGPTSSAKGLSFATTDRSYSRFLNARGFLRANVTSAGLARGFGSGGLSNWNYEPYLSRR